MNAAKREKAKNKAEATGGTDDSYKNIAKVYKGIALTEESNLKKKNARSLVQPFQKSEIKYAGIMGISGCNNITSATSQYLHSLDAEEALKSPTSN